MPNIEELRQKIVEPLRDLKLNLEGSTGSLAGSLDAAQRWGVIVAAACASRHAELTNAVIQAARTEVSQEVIDDGIAAAGLMAMNNVYYRFRHLIQKPSYSDMPARLRMTRIARPATNKPDFELFCLAVSAINGCETCLRSHEEAVLSGGLSEAHVHDAVRLAAALHGAAVSLEISELESVARPG